MRLNPSKSTLLWNRLPDLAGEYVKDKGELWERDYFSYRAGYLAAVREMNKLEE